MKQEIKIVLPAYKIFYSLFFPVVLCLIRGVARADEIGGALDSNMALLSLGCCAETWVMERSGRRWEIFTLYPVKNRTKTVLRRLAVQLCYLCVLSYVGYFFYYWQKPAVPLGKTAAGLYGSYLPAIMATVIFFGVLSMTLSNLFQNQWAGIGGSFLLWLTLYSTSGDKVLGRFNIFAYAFRELDGPEDFSWLWGKAAGILIAVFLLGWLPHILKKRG